MKLLIQPEADHTIIRARAGRARTALVLALTAAGMSLQAQGQQPLTLPRLADSVRFAVIGDMGTGSAPQYEIGARMETLRQRFLFEFVITLGDNIYGSNTPRDFVRKFEQPYKPLLDGGVKFYASVGNHDALEERAYEPFNMGGKAYYSFTKGNVAFFVLDSNLMNTEQITWLKKALMDSDADWKIAYFHHPLYSSAAFHGSSLPLRKLLEPVLVKYGVDVVFAGHDHVYERLKPQKGIAYFVEGASGQLRKGNLVKNAPLTAVGFDRDLSFMLVEIAGDALSFETISRSGATVDSGVIMRRPIPPIETK